MRAFGFLSFGHYGHAAAHGGLSARQMLHDAIDISVGAEELGVNGAYFRVHHFATQSAAPMPLLSAVAARTQRIEVGTGVIDMRYENPLQLAEEAAALDLIADGRVALGVSRGSPEPADRGWEAFGYTGSTDPRGADIAREKFELFLRAVRGEPMARASQQPYGAPVQPGAGLRIEPHSPGLIQRIWWGAGSRDSAETVGRHTVHLRVQMAVGRVGGVADQQSQLPVAAGGQPAGHEVVHVAHRAGGLVDADLGIGGDLLAAVLEHAGDGRARDPCRSCDVLHRRWT